jgi:hypothetical protein
MSQVIPAIDLYDSEILLIEKVLEKLNEKQGRHVQMEDFRREIIGRFEEIGLIVSVMVYSTADSGGLPIDDVYAFDITISDRCERKPFDMDRQRYEVVNDVADIEPEMKGVTFAVPDYEPTISGDHPHHH